MKLWFTKKAKRHNNLKKRLVRNQIRIDELLKWQDDLLLTNNNKAPEEVLDKVQSLTLDIKKLVADSNEITAELLGIEI